MSPLAMSVLLLLSELKPPFAFQRFGICSVVDKSPSKVTLFDNALCLCCISKVHGLMIRLHKGVIKVDFQGETLNPPG